MSIFPNTRLRRLRINQSLRDIFKETSLSLNDFIKPIFIISGTNIKLPIPSLPGQYQLSIDQAVFECKKTFEKGIKAVLLFGIPPIKDSSGLCATEDSGIIQNAVKQIKDLIPELIIITDLCFCEYTTHGHCGIFTDNYLDNDKTLEILLKQALSHAKAGVDIIAPSGMIDGAILNLRNGLDNEGYIKTLLMGYSSKFASSFYGPFRDAVNSTPELGDRKTYQMQFGNRREALREALIDIEEGVDIVMVKPALPYLDIISDLRQKTLLPIAAYQVSGEYSMIKAAAQNGWIDEKSCIIESITAIKRAGADLIITYFCDELIDLYNK